MDIKYVALSEVMDNERFKPAITQGERSWPFRLVGDTGTIYMNVSEGEIRNMLKQMTEIVEGL